MVDREVTIDDLKPMNDYRNRHEYWYQVGACWYDLFSLSLFNRRSG